MELLQVIGNILLFNCPNSYQGQVTMEFLPQSGIVSIPLEQSPNLSI